MAVLSFQDRIADLAGSLSTTDDNALQQWLIDGCYDVITRNGITTGIPEMEFAQQSIAYSSAMAVDVSNIRQLLDVARNGYNCKRIAHIQRNFVDPNHVLGTDSIYKATDIDPVFYILDNQLVVKPNPTASEQGYYSYIPEYSIDAFSSTTSSIDKFPAQYNEHIILYASIKVLDRQLLDLISNSDIDTAIAAVKTQLTDAQNKFTSFSSRTFGDEDTFITDKSQVAQVLDALSNAKSLIDAGATTDYLGEELTNNVIELLNDEDSEMVQSTVSAFQAEVSRAQAELSHWQTVGQIGLEEVNKSLSIVQALMSDIQSRVERDSQKYKWHQERRNNLQQEYLSKFPAPQGSKGGQ